MNSKACISTNCGSEAQKEVFKASFPQGISKKTKISRKIQLFFSAIIIFYTFAFGLPVTFANEQKLDPKSSVVIGVNQDSSPAKSTDTGINVKNKADAITQDDFGDLVWRRFIHVLYVFY